MRCGELVVLAKRIDEVVYGVLERGGDDVVVVVMFWDVGCLIRLGGVVVEAGVVVLGRVGGRRDGVDDLFRGHC